MLAKYGAPTPGASGGFFPAKPTSPWEQVWNSHPRGLRRFFPGKNDIPLGTSMVLPPQVASGGFFPKKRHPPGNKYGVPTPGAFGVFSGKNDDP